MIDLRSVMGEHFVRQNTYSPPAKERAIHAQTRRYVEVSTGN
jgi:hypothetical protein